jgi:hypothetical protein
MKISKEKNEIKFQKNNQWNHIWFPWKISEIDKSFARLRKRDKIQAIKMKYKSRNIANNLAEIKWIS